MDSYSVTVVGPSGSGKTVYLASLFRRLAVNREAVGFFVQTDFSSAKLLNHTYGEITRPGAWPGGTMLDRVQELAFTCSVRSLHGVFSPFAIKYVDYGGGLLTDVYEDGATAADDIEDRLGKANVLLVFLDGMKVVNYLEGDSRLVDELVPVFNQLQDSTAVIHFVITKWDLLHNTHTLKEVASSLLDHPDLSGFVDHHARMNERAGAIRLFPVSSVGLGFADRGPDAQMVKRPGARPHPLNVEIPFAAVLPDLFEQASQLLLDPAPDEELEQRGRLLARLRGISGLLPAAKKVLLKRAVASPAIAGLGEGIFDSFSDWADSRISVYEGRLEADRARHRAEAEKIASNREAMKHLVEAFELLLADFECAYPGSQLSSRA